MREYLKRPATLLALVMTFIMMGKGGDCSSALPNHNGILRELSENRTGNLYLNGFVPLNSSIVVERAPSSTKTYLNQSTGILNTTSHRSSSDIHTQMVNDVNISEAFMFNDTSIQFVSKIKSIYNGYIDIFTDDFSAILKGPEPSDSIFKYFEGISDQDSQIYIEQNFLFPGNAETRTKENCYIVKLKNGVRHKTVTDIKSFLRTINSRIKASLENSMKGVIVCFESDELPMALLRSISWIDIIERDQLFTATQKQNNAPWGLARLSKAEKSVFSSSYSFNLTGEGVTMYVIDSGVWESHPEFTGRARLGYSAFEGKLGFDCSGHGTEVTSIMAGLNVGVAKKADIVVAQVLDCTGQGSNSDLVTAIEWIVKNGKPPAVINISVGGPASPSLDESVANAVNQGFNVIVAAGNSGKDACMTSPSSASGAIVVGASNEDNSIAKFSNYGKCITLFAPGTNILAASIPSKKKRTHKYQGYDYVSGTSMAAPFAAGVVALLLQSNPSLKPHQVKRSLIELSAKNILSRDGLKSSPNFLLQSPPGDSSRTLVTFFEIGSMLVPQRAGCTPWSLEKYMIASTIVFLVFFVLLMLWLLKHRKRL